MAVILSVFYNYYPPEELKDPDYLDSKDAKVDIVDVDVYYGNPLDRMVNDNRYIPPIITIPLVTETGFTN